jgi:hypothetical protein
MLLLFVCEVALAVGDTCTQKVVKVDRLILTGLLIGVLCAAFVAVRLVLDSGSAESAVL